MLSCSVVHSTRRTAINADIRLATVQSDRNIAVVNGCNIFGPALNAALTEVPSDRRRPSRSPHQQCLTYTTWTTRQRHDALLNARTIRSAAAMAVQCAYMYGFFE